MEKRFTENDALMSATPEDVTDDIIENSMSYTKEDLLNMYKILRDAKIGMIRSMRDNLRDVLPEKCIKYGYDSVFVYLVRLDRWHTDFYIDPVIDQTSDCCADGNGIAAYAIVCKSSDMDGMLDQSLNMRDIFNASCGIKMTFNPDYTEKDKPVIFKNNITVDREYSMSMRLERRFSIYNISEQLKVDKSIMASFGELSSAIKLQIASNIEKWMDCDAKAAVISDAFYFMRDFTDTSRDTALIISVLHHEYANRSITVKFTNDYRSTDVRFTSDGQLMVICGYNWLSDTTDRSKVCEIFRRKTVPAEDYGYEEKDMTDIKGKDIMLNKHYIGNPVKRRIYNQRFNYWLAEFDKDAPEPKTRGRKKSVK